MLTLLILRHAKSGRDNPYLTDHDRILDERGLREAPLMGHVLAKEHLVPDLILSSTAKRALHTAELAASASGYHHKIKTDRLIYESQRETLIHVLSQTPDDCHSVLLVGHNPDLEILVEALTRESVELSTATLVQLALPIKQRSELTLSIKAKIKNIWRPKDIVG